MKILPKKIMIYPPRRAQSTQSFKTVQSLFRFSGAFAFSVCSAVKFKDVAISLENSTVLLIANIIMGDWNGKVESGLK